MQPSKAELPMDVNAGGRLVRASEVQPKKASLPMDVTFGMLIDTSAVQ